MLPRRANTRSGTHQRLLLRFAPVIKSASQSVALWTWLVFQSKNHPSP